MENGMWENYIGEQKKSVGKRIQQIRTYLAYSTYEFATLVGITESTIINIEKGEGFNSNTISTISFFTGLPLREIFDYKGTLPDQTSLKAQFLENVKKVNLKNYDFLNKKRTTVKSMLEELITKTDYFDTPRKTHEVREALQQKFGIETTSPTISQALSNATKAGLLKKKIKGLRNYVYQK